MVADEKGVMMIAIRRCVVVTAVQEWACYHYST